MASAGDLVVTLTADQAEFTTGMQKASETVNTFGDTANKTTGHMGKFNAHMLTSRHALGTFAMATGTALGPLSHLIHGFMLAPGPIGAVIAGILLFKEVLNDQSEAAKKAAEANAAYYKTMVAPALRSRGEWTQEMKKEYEEYEKYGKEAARQEKIAKENRRPLAGATEIDEQSRIDAETAESAQKRAMEQAEFHKKNSSS